jgi:hypothetical protein
MYRLTIPGECNTRLRVGVGDNDQRSSFPEIVGRAKSELGKPLLVEFLVKESQPVRFLKPFSQIAQVLDGYYASSAIQFF